MLRHWFTKTSLAKTLVCKDKWNALESPANAYSFVTSQYKLRPLHQTNMKLL
jgi:hypothetical protein